MTRAKVRKVGFGMALVVGGLWALGHGGALASPMTMIRTKTERVRVLLAEPTTEGTAAHEKKKKNLKKVLRSLLNYTELARRSLWIHWKDRSRAERREFVGILKQLIEERVLSNVSGTSEFSIEHGEPVMKGALAAIKSTVRIPNKPEIEIEYKLKKHGSKWRVYDLITDGTSLVRNYRSQFNKIIRRDGYPALVEKMKEKLRKPESSGRIANAVHTG